MVSNSKDQSKKQLKSKLKKTWYLKKQISRYLKFLSPDSKILSEFISQTDFDEFGTISSNLDNYINDAIKVYNQVHQKTRVISFSHHKIIDNISKQTEFMYSRDYPDIINLFLLITDKYPNIIDKYSSSFDITDSELSSFKSFVQNIKTNINQINQEKQLQIEEVGNWINTYGRNIARLFHFLIRNKKLPEELRELNQNIYQRDTIYTEFAPLNIQLCAEKECNNQYIIIANLDNVITNVNICTTDLSIQSRKIQSRKTQSRKHQSRKTQSRKHQSRKTQSRKQTKKKSKKFKKYSGGNQYKVENNINILPKKIRKSIIRSLLLPNLLNKTKNIHMALWTCPNKKLIPTEYQNKIVFGPKEVNSAATDRTQMAIFRQEELNKSIFHESIHYLNIDFRSYPYNDRIYKMFNINPENEIRVFEAYTELVAEIMNCIACAYEIVFNKDLNQNIQNITNIPSTRSNSKKQDNNLTKISISKINKIRKIAKVFLELEKRFSCFQVAKILVKLGYTRYQDFLILNSTDTIQKKNKNKTQNKTKTKNQNQILEQSTYLLSYFFIKSAILNNVEELFNTMIPTTQNIIFTENNSNFEIFQSLIEKSIVEPKYIDNVNRYIELIKQVKTKNKDSDKLFILNSLRMTCIEVE